MKKLVKLSLKEAKYDTRFPNKLIGCQSSSSTMASKEVKLSKTLSLKSLGKELLIIQVHIDDVVFEATLEVLCEEFVALMNSEFWSEQNGRIKFLLGAVDQANL